MSNTNMSYGAPGAMIQQAAGVFHQNTQRSSVMRHLTGMMPKISDAANGVRTQSKATMPIVRCQDLGKNKGDEISFNFINPVSAYPIMGSAFAEGKGSAMSIATSKLRVNQVRFPVGLGDAMTDIRSPVAFREMGRPIAQKMMDGYVDQSLLVHMAGARGFHDNEEWYVPTAAHENFNEIMVNTVRAPTKNRHLIVDGGNGVKEFKVNSGEVDLVPTDLFKMDTLDSGRLWLESIALPPPPVIFDGDKMAGDSPLRVWLVSPAQFSGYATDPAFRTYQAYAQARGRDNPLFQGQDTILFNGFLIVKMPRPIRFYAGDTIKYCASNTSETESSCVVPDSFGTTHAVDRSIMLGGQAVAEALAASDKGGLPFFWSEKEMDHGDKVELLIGAIRGVSKVRFGVKRSTGDVHFTDHGVTVIDSAAPIHQARS